MKRNKIKKIALICFVIGALVFSFWYGGDAPGLHGFSIEEDTYISTDDQRGEKDGADDEVVTSGGEVSAEGDGAVSGGEASASGDHAVSGGEVSASEDGANSGDKVSAGGDGGAKTAESGEKEKFSFKKIFMKIIKTGSSKKSQKNNPQYNKKATRNANKAADKGKKNTKKSADNSGSGKSSSKKNSSRKNSEKTSDKSNTSKDDEEDDASKDSSGAKEEVSKDNGSEDDSKENNITCTIDIACTSVLKYMDKLTEAKRKVIPENGVILDTVYVEVKEGSTVFDVLQKAARDNKVHLEYNYTPAYKTYYIEGIGNLYQFDAGNLSGWMYSVNGEFPGVGCSGYKVKDGDVISWVYTCSFGKDVGGYYEE